MHLSVFSDWPPALPNLREQTEFRLGQQTRDYFIDHKLDRTGRIAEAEDHDLVFKLSPSVSTKKPVAVRHGLYIESGRSDALRMLRREDSIAVLRRLPAPNRVSALRILAWDYMKDLMRQVDADHPAEKIIDLQKIVREQQRTLQPILFEIELSVTDEAMLKFLDASYTPPA